MQLLLTGETFTAQRALDLGLVNAVVAHDRLLPAARALLERILVHSPLAVASILTAITRGLNQSIGEGLLVEAEQFARVAPTADLREGLDAWMARRAPAYRGSWFSAASSPERP
jgi:enoyl-CoA hydratase/carnithine racemase